MVESGQRNLDLNKIPRLADVLGLSREDLCKLALFEAAPALYSTLFDSSPSGKVRIAGDAQSGSIQTPAADFNSMLNSLPEPIRRAVEALVESLSTALSPPYRRR